VLDCCLGFFLVMVQLYVAPVFCHELLLIDPKN